MENQPASSGRKNIESQRAEELKMKLDRLAIIKKSILEKNPSTDNERLSFLLKRL